MSDKLKGAASDLVVKSLIKTEDETLAPLDIYILLEHKSFPDGNSLIQLLKYMYLEWQKDADQKKTLRVIIPLIFYHGETKWTVPRSFVDKFQVSDAIKKFLLNFTYLFFDTRDWDFMATANQDLKDNVFLFTTLVLMKNAFNKNMEVVHEILKLWVEKGFITEKERVTALLMYITEIRNVEPEELMKILEENKINGGEIMHSLAQRFRDEGKEHWVNFGLKEGLEKTARNLLSMGMEIEKIAAATGLSKMEIEKLSPTTH